MEEETRDILARFFVKIGDHLVSDLETFSGPLTDPVSPRVKNEMA
jgi:hypothetical protein